MYDDPSHSAGRLTEESFRLWEQHIEEYVATRADGCTGSGLIGQPSRRGSITAAHIEHAHVEEMRSQLHIWST
jgi:hypothetical protein